MFKRRQKRRWKKLARAAAVAVVCMTELSGVRGADDSVSREYQIKANFLALAPKFVEWPKDALANGARTFQTCAYGAFPFGTALAELTRTTEVNGKRVELRWVRRESELRSCQIVFVSRSEEKHYGKILADLRDTSALTVGETADFVEAGGIVSLETHERGLEIEVNLEAAQRARLKISSQLLTLARRVIGRVTSARS
ncbi:MAG TPA: YfiR family protein [Candidatus Acidoferrum sp.]|nr:YfiR family protein [Candidatus Acidoferrum sp.]